MGQPNPWTTLVRRTLSSRQRLDAVRRWSSSMSAVRGCRATSCLRYAAVASCLLLVVNIYRWSTECLYGNTRDVSYGDHRQPR